MSNILPINIEKQTRSADILAARLADFERHLENNFPQHQNIVEALIGMENVLGEEENQVLAASRTEHVKKVKELMVYLERVGQTPERDVEIYTDPNLDTYCCAVVPAKKISKDGEISLDRTRKSYLIGVPTKHLLGLAPKDFLRGEITHEMGHALWTNFAMNQRIRRKVELEKYDPALALMLLNCLEDPRMERLTGGRMHAQERWFLFQKNSFWIIPSIVKNLAKGSPVEQFCMLTKLDKIWELHREDWPQIGIDPDDKPWKTEELNEDVQRLFAQIKPDLDELAGDAIRPSLKNNDKVEELFMQKFWPVLRELIDKYPLQENSQTQGSGKSSQSTGTSGRGSNASASANMPKEDEHYDPADSSTWPDEMKKFLQSMIDKHQKRLENKAEQQKNQNELDKKRSATREEALHSLRANRDGIDSPEDRAKYNQMVRTLRAQILQVERVFKKYLPTVAEPERLNDRRGNNFNVAAFVSRYGSGYEKPMIRKGDLEQKGLALQILVDISGSMKGERIENAVKACLVALEAAGDSMVDIEILASDDENYTTQPEYLIKSFGEKYNGQVKQRLVRLLEACTKGNKDAEAIRAALPRMESGLRKMRSKTDRSAGLTVFISDSTTQSTETREAADDSRKKIPFEGTAISEEADIAQMVKYHFGEDSVVPASVQEFPKAFQTIMERHIRQLKSRN